MVNQNIIDIRKELNIYTGNKLIQNYNYSLLTHLKAIKNKILLERFSGTNQNDIKIIGKLL
jgi:hypothetical protein